MSHYLLWGGLAALVPAVLVVLGAAYGRRAIKHARATRMEIERLGVFTSDAGYQTSCIEATKH
jgi:hypothetical protein